MYRKYRVYIHITGDPNFLRIPAKQVIAGSNHVYVPETIFGCFYHEVHEGLEVFLLHYLHGIHGDYYLPHTSSILS